jgi:hypothetical protein
VGRRVVGFQQLRGHQLDGRGVERQDVVGEDLERGVVVGSNLERSNLVGADVEREWMVGGGMGCGRRALGALSRSVGEHHLG